MQIQEWEIWYTYSTYLESTKIDLDEAARLLVESGVALCAMHRDGRAYWRSKGAATHSGHVVVQISETGRRASIRVKPDQKDSTYHDFVEQALFEAAHFRFNEMRLYGSDSFLPPPYIRMMLGQCNLGNTKQEVFIRCYPVIKLYESGVLTIELRIMSPDRSIEAKDFIQEYVNLFQMGFDLVEVPPSISKIGTRSYYQTLRKWPIWNRWKLRRLSASHDEAVEALTSDEDSGDFRFRLAPLSREEGFNDTLASFIQSLFGVVAFVISKPRDGIGFLLFGQKKLVRIGNFWTGRPHIYLVRFEGQEEKASGNEVFNSVFGRILARHWTEDAAFGSRHLPPNSRYFEDYAAYIGVSASLWVWSKQGLSQQREWTEVNRAHLIYEPQATMELLEYAFMLHKRVFEEAVSHATSSAVIHARRELAILENRMSQVSHFMEIQELLRQGWRAMGIPELQNQTKEILQIRQNETSTKEAETAERTRRLLAILFGLLAVPRIAVDVVGPIWEYFQLWRPSDKSLAQLFMIGLAASGVASITLLLLKIAGRRWRSKI